MVTGPVMVMVIVIVTVMPRHVTACQNFITVHCIGSRNGVVAKNFLLTNFTVDLSFSLRYRYRYQSLAPFF